MKYRVVAMPDGYAVAYFHAAGGWVADSMHCTRPSADTAADTKNLQYQSQLALAVSSKAQNRQHALRVERRAVRWVPDDEFA